MNKQLLEKFSKVYQETSKAYADCHLGYDVGIATRNLMYCSEIPLSIDSAIDVFSKYVKSYNGFKPDVLKYLKEVDENGKIYIARESSVCVYFETNVDIGFNDRIIDFYSFYGSIFYGKMLTDELMNIDPTVSGHKWNVKTNNFIYRIWWD